MMRKLIATTTIALACAWSAGSPVHASTAQEPPEFVPGEVLVGLVGGGERVLELPQAVGVGEAARALRSNEAIAYAAPNYVARASGVVPNDVGLGTAPGDWQRTQWNFLPCGSLCEPGAPPGAVTTGAFEARGGIDATGAWAVLKQRGAALGKGAKVAVLDTGVAYRGKAPRFKRSPDFVKKQFAPGYDFVKGNELPLDRDGHGTHVTGTIAERAGNRRGLVGLASRARVIPVRVLDANGLGTARDISRGIRFAAKQGADVINMSFEFALSVDRCAKIKSVCKAIKFAFKRGRCWSPQPATPTASRSPSRPGPRG